jgi:hypothetical protein
MTVEQPEALTYVPPLIFVQKLLEKKDIRVMEVLGICGELPERTVKHSEKVQQPGSDGRCGDSIGWSARVLVS